MRLDISLATRALRTSLAWSPASAPLPDLSIQDITALLVSITNLSVSCYPDRLEYVDQVLGFAHDKIQEFATRYVNTVESCQKYSFAVAPTCTLHKQLPIWQPYCSRRSTRINLCSPFSPSNVTPRFSHCSRSAPAARFHTLSSLLSSKTKPSSKRQRTSMESWNFVMYLYGTSKTARSARTRLHLKRRGVSGEVERTSTRRRRWRRSKDGLREWYICSEQIH